VNCLAAEWSKFRLRVATAEDAGAIGELIALSVRGLSGGYYTEEEMDGALGTVLGLDSQLIADGTYFVMEVSEAAGPDGVRVAASGGWSYRKTLFGGDRLAGRENDLLDPERDAAKIRAIFVHPEFARMGLGSAVLEHVESAAEAAGFRRFEMGATLPGVPLYLLRGYVEIGRVRVPLGNGEGLEVVRMGKTVRS